MIRWSVGLPQSNVTVLLAYGIYVSVAVLSLCSYTIIKEYRPAVTAVSAVQMTAVAIAFVSLGLTKHGYSPSRITKTVGSSTF